jgi:YD repeat-containing protein
MFRRAVFFLATLAGPPAHAEEVKYSYDALGRLERVDKKEGKSATYSFDAAGNRKRLIVADSLANDSCELSVNDIESNDEFSSFFTISRSGPCPTGTAVTYNTVDGTAKSGVHYYHAQGSVSFSEGETIKSVMVSPYYLSIPIGQALEFYLDIRVNSGSGLATKSRGRARIVSNR